MYAPRIPHAAPIAARTRPRPGPARRPGPRGDFLLPVPRPRFGIFAGPASGESSQAGSCHPGPSRHSCHPPPPGRFRPCLGLCSRSYFRSFKVHVSLVTGSVSSFCFWWFPPCAMAVSRREPCSGCEGPLTCGTAPPGLRRPGVTASPLIWGHSFPSGPLPARGHRHRRGAAGCSEPRLSAFPLLPFRPKS